MIALGTTRRVAEAHRLAVRHLLALRRPEGFWEGRLSSSALSTATAMSALSQAGMEEDAPLLRGGAAWLAAARNADGGWGDTPDSPSNLSTTLLALSALRLASAAGCCPPSPPSLGDMGCATGFCPPSPPMLGGPACSSPPMLGGPACSSPPMLGGLGGSAPDRSVLDAAEGYVTRHAGSTPEERVAALGRIYGADRTFAVPILMNCALAGLVPWEGIPGLPFEMALFPQRAYRVLRLHVVSYALPALIAIGVLLARRAPARFPATRVLRRLAEPAALRRLETLQPDHGGFLEATPLTSFVAMSLLPLFGPKQAVAARCLRFLRASVRPDGSWPIDTNLSVWLTTGAVSALLAGERPVDADLDSTRRWLLERQYRTPHPYTGAAPGGWSWTHLPGGVPDADDTSGALVALTRIEETPFVVRPFVAARAGAVTRATANGQGAAPEGATANSALSTQHSALSTSQWAGAEWLLGLQNQDGGWPTFCRGWGKLPFDRSSPDITAHALRALRTVGCGLRPAPDGLRPAPDGLRPAPGGGRVRRAMARGLDYLARVQRKDGAWVPLWFGNQEAPGHANPVFGTARVLVALSEGGNCHLQGERGIQYLVAAQGADGGWGGDRGCRPSVEETALATGALALFPEHADARRAMLRGAARLAEWIEAGTWTRPAPIGLYFASLWYSEELYPVIWTVEALGRVLAQGVATP